MAHLALEIIPVPVRLIVLLQVVIGGELHAWRGGTGEATGGHVSTRVK